MALFPEPATHDQRAEGAGRAHCRNDDFALHALAEKELLQHAVSCVAMQRKDRPFIQTAA